MMTIATTTTTTSSTSACRCALNSAPRPPPFRGGHLIFTNSGGAAARGGLVRRMDALKSDADGSSSDAMKMTPVRRFFGHFWQGDGVLLGKVQYLQTEQKIAFFSFNFK